MGECHPAGDSAWWLLQLAVEKPRQAILSLPAQMGVENAPFSVSNILGSFQYGGALSGRRALTIECSLMSGCGQNHKRVKDMWKKLWLMFPGLHVSHNRSGNAYEKSATGLNKTSRKYDSVVKGF